MKDLTLEQVMAMPWPVEEITALMMQSNASEERNRLGALRKENSKHAVTAMLETEQVTLEVQNEKV